jgi:phage terminase large subunit-like protein
MSPPAKEIERLVVSKRIVHPDNPVMNWCVANAVVEQDAEGNIKPSRKKRTEKLDGVVAMTMAVGRMMERGADGNVYVGSVEPRGRARGR